MSDDDISSGVAPSAHTAYVPYQVITRGLAMVSSMTGVAYEARANRLP